MKHCHTMDVFCAWYWIYSNKLSYVGWLDHRNLVIHGHGVLCHLAKMPPELMICFHLTLHLIQHFFETIYNKCIQIFPSKVWTFRSKPDDALLRTDIIIHNFWTLVLIVVIFTQLPHLFLSFYLSVCIFFLPTFGNFL